MLVLDQQSLIEHLQETILSTGEVLVVGISGYGGAGKSTFARTLSAEIPGSVVIGVDQFYVKEKDIVGDDWGCFDRGQMRQQIEAVKREATAIICEGVGIFHPDTVDYFLVRIWVNADLETATIRGMARDRDEQGQDHDRLWREIWEPNERRFEAKHDPKSRATHMLIAQ